MKTLHFCLDSLSLGDPSDTCGPEPAKVEHLYCNVLGVSLTASHDTVPATITTARTEGDVVANIGPVKSGDTVHIAADVGTVAIVIDETDTLAVLFLVVLWNHRGFSNDQARFVYEHLRDALVAELNERTLVELVQLGNAEQHEELSDAIKARIQGPALLNALKTFNLSAITPDQTLGTFAKLVSAGDILTAGATDWEHTLWFPEGEAGGRDGGTRYLLRGRVTVV
jgi:hypothetical protein